MFVFAHNNGDFDVLVEVGTGRYGTEYWKLRSQPLTAPLLAEGEVPTGKTATLSVDPSQPKKASLRYDPEDTGWDKLKTVHFVLNKQGWEEVSTPGKVYAQFSPGIDCRIRDINYV